MTRPFLSALLILATFVSTSLARAADLVLADGGKSDYRIVVADDASPSTRYAAKELQTFLAQISAAKLPIVTDREAATGHEIVLGASSRLKALGSHRFPRLGDEGYVIRTAGPHLLIAGGPARQPLRRLRLVGGPSRLPLVCSGGQPDSAVARLALGPIDENKVPVLEYREPYTWDCFDGDWCARNRVNSSSARLEARHGGKVRFGDGFFVHTFARLVPPGKVFCRAPRVLFAGRRQAAGRLCAALLHERRRDPDLHGGDPRGDAGPARRHRVLRLAERHRPALRVPKCQALARRKGARWRRCWTW